MNATWKDVVGYESFYIVSCDGRIKSMCREGKTSFGPRSYGGGDVKPIKNSNGYLVVNLTANGKRKQLFVHRIVLDAFMRPKIGNEVCRHKDGDKTNNSVLNLSWGTQKENIEDQIRHGTHRRGELNGKSKLNNDAVMHIRTSTRPIKEIACEYGVSSSCVRKAKYRETWRHVE